MAENTARKSTPIRVSDTFCGKVAVFDSNKQFQKFMKWRAIFNQCAPNKQFSFMLFARNAIGRVREDLKRNAYYADDFEMSEKKRRPRRTRAQMRETKFA